VLPSGSPDVFGIKKQQVDGVRAVSSVLLAAIWRNFYAVVTWLN
jgi:hypothetical protein